MLAYIMRKRAYEERKRIARSMSLGGVYRVRITITIRN